MVLRQNLSTWKRRKPRALSSTWSGRGVREPTAPDGSSSLPACAARPLLRPRPLSLLLVAALLRPGPDHAVSPGSRLGAHATAPVARAATSLFVRLTLGPSHASHGNPYLKRCIVAAHYTPKTHTVGGSSCDSSLSKPLQLTSVVILSRYATIPLCVVRLVAPLKLSIAMAMLLGLVNLHSSRRGPCR